MKLSSLVNILWPFSCLSMSSATIPNLVRLRSVDVPSGFIVGVTVAS
jgi:hypothetical protein